MEGRDESMSNTSAILRSAGIAAGLAAAYLAAAQDAPRFTARELFYSAGEQASSGKPATANAKPPAKSPATATAATGTKSQRPTQVATNTPKPPTPTTPTTTRPASNPTTVASARPTSSGVTIAATAPDGSPIIRASDGPPETRPAPASGPALGLKITLLKRTNNQDVEIDPSTEFHAGDKIRFSIQTNGPGYLYIVNQGSSGTWKPLFPSPEIADGDNHVDGWHAYTMPPKSALVFDEQTGTEKIFIVFSRDPEPEFENMIYSLPGATKGNAPAVAPTSAPTRPASQPQSAPPARQQKEMLVTASLNVPDSAINRMRRTYSRDLIIEKVDDSTPASAAAPAAKKEKAVYVVNPTGSNDPRVVADLTLVHK